jgi:hypothetical protein
MDETIIEALLGRTLTDIESDNFNLYLNIAEENLEELICTPIESVTEDRVFNTREGYSTAFVDIFNELNSVEIDGEVIDTSEYSVRQWDRRNASWYNSIVFEDKFGSDVEITVNADWGFLVTSGDDSDFPVDLQMLIAELFGLISRKNKSDSTIASKQVEDFRISFNADADLDDEFYTKYSSTISKYSLCLIPYFKQGKTGREC